MQANAASSPGTNGETEESTVSTGITILKHPQSINVTVNSRFSLNVTTKSDMPLRYQWYKNNQAIPGATSSSYSVNKSVQQDQGLYHVVVSNEVTSLSSYAASVNISSGSSYLKITRQPLGKTIINGQALRLEVEVTGEGPYTYQWYKDGNAIAGANTDIYQIPVSDLADAGLYQVQIANSFSTVESGFASVIITNIEIPPAEISISVQPQSTSTTENQAFTLSVTANSAEALRYQWYKDNQVINGAVAASYTRPTSTKLDEGVYYVVVSNNQRSLKSHAAFVEVIQESIPLSILQAPQSRTLAEGQQLLLQVEAIGQGQLVYRWFKNGMLISGANSNTINISNARRADSGDYQVQISSGSSSIESSVASITITPEAPQSDTDTAAAPSPSPEPEPDPAGDFADPPLALTITQPPESKTIAESDGLLLRVQVSGDGPFTYQWQKNGSLLPYANHSNFFIPSARKSDQGSYRVVISNSSQTIYSEFVNVWVMDKIEPVTITSHPESQLVAEGTTKQLSVAVIGDGFISYQWRKNGEPIANAYSSSLTLTDVHEDDAGYYDVVVANSQGSKISNPAYVDVLSYSPALVITEQPRAQLIRSGQALSLSVNAHSDSDLRYQWFLNGEPIDGANTATYHIMQAGMTDAGRYSVEVSDAYDTQHSLPAEVSLYEPETFAIELSWDTPRSREDGSPLASDEIREYIIEYGYEDHLLNQRISIPNRYVNRFILDGIYPGRLLLRIATVDIDGHQGHFSDIISVIID